jgi:hypothetical protein
MGNSLPTKVDYQFSNYFLNPEVTYPPFNTGKIHDIEITINGQTSKYRNMDLIRIIKEYHPEVIGNPIFFPRVKENSDIKIKIIF